ncbi:hypothetical protein Patl1_04066 [Pistacia atlantica]|uniref:Uncharacterized protein n=1 Tax=Pistacia atlantica TaxID=434234 RepID=A0ACC1BW44_9ROSI|nr:hypothetical protein Patl1_04066 [Pistacia atlantica]
MKKDGDKAVEDAYIKPMERKKKRKDLASADVSLRQAAAESLVTELEEVQKAYERGGKELVKNGIKLEADKDVGLNDRAPSVTYGVCRLIRGVSSSRL